MEQDAEGRLFGLINGGKRLLVDKHSHLDGVRGCIDEDSHSSPYSLLNSQSVGHGLQETPGYLTIIEQLDHVFSARFAHPPPQTAVLHESQEVRGDVRHAGSVLRCPRVWKHDAMAIVDPVAFPEYRLADLPLLCYLR